MADNADQFIGRIELVVGSGIGAAIFATTGSTLIASAVAGVGSAEALEAGKLLAEHRWTRRLAEDDQPRLAERLAR